LPDHRKCRADGAIAAATATATAATAPTRRVVRDFRALRLLRSLLIGSTALCASLAFAAGLVIQSPQPGQRLHDNRGHVTVLLAVEDQAELPRGFSFRVLLDGQPAAPDRPEKRIPLTGVLRGTHVLQALIIDGDGQVLTRSPVLTFTLHRASRLNPP